MALVPTLNIMYPSASLCYIYTYLEIKSTLDIELMYFIRLFILYHIYKILNNNNKKTIKVFLICALKYF